MDFNKIVLILLLGSLLSACTGSGPSSSSPSPDGSSHSNTFSASASTQPITYRTGAQDVLIRTFHGGGLYGALEIAPEVSIYGNGTYILGLDRQGKLTTDELQQLLHTLVDTYGLLDMKHQQFSDVQDQNATFLEVALNGKQQEFMYGAFGSQQEPAQSIDEYHRLEKALTAITEALKGPTRPYNSTSIAILARQNFSPDFSQTIFTWPLSDYTLAQLAVYECGIVPSDETSRNAETACLKYTIPQNAVLLTPAQFHTLSAQTNGQQRMFVEQEDGLYYTIFLRPLLPDELSRKTLAMFGSAQLSFKGVPLLEGVVPPVPTPTPSK